MLKTFIERPVLSTVISILIVVLGIVGLSTLPVEQYPDIAPPTVSVQAVYSGADASAVMNSVVIPLEEAINGVEGMTYMTSNASNTGMAFITVYFKKGVDPDIAAVNVQNLVATATPMLPAEVTRTGVTVQKRQSSTIMMISMTSNNPDYDGKFLQNFANINVVPQIKRVFGVGDASAMGAKDYSMRVWLKPDVMSTYKVSPAEVYAAIGDQNIEAAPGELGANSGRQTFQYSMKYTGRLKSVEEFENIIIRSTNGQILRLKDVADVELGSLNYTVSTFMDGKESIGIGINQTAGSNAQEVIENVKAVVAEASKTFPPGVEVTYLMDASEFLNESISKVVKTLLEALVLVFLVVFIFLQDFKSTFIPAVAVPVSIIGTFFFLQIFGFSINLLTLFALILAIGIVVDDAIIVVEAVHAQLEAGEKDPKQAALKAMKEIAPAIVAITLVMSFVFVPVSFIGGTAGIFYKQFGLTLAVAILISAVNALTLSPALCALLLKPKEDNGEKKKGFLQRFFYFFNISFNYATTKYKNTLHFLGKRGHRWITVSIIGVAILLFAYLMKITPAGFVPQEDSGSIMGFVTMPPGASLERTEEVVQQVFDIIEAEVPSVAHKMTISGVNFMGGGIISSSYATVLIKLDPWKDRDVSANDVAAMLTEKTRHIQNATFMFFGTPTLQGFGISSGVEMQLQDKTGGDINEFYGIAQNFINQVNQREEVMMGMTTFNPSFPQKMLEVNVAKVKESGMTLTSVMQTLQMYVGGFFTSNFNLYGKQFRIMMQASPEYRETQEDLNRIFVQTGTGEMAPITEYITITDITGPQLLSRFNMFSSMDVTIIPNMVKGYSTGDAIKAVEEVAANTLPLGYGFEYSGLTREEASSGQQTIIIFALCLIFVYLLLAGLYESYILPLSVIFSLPVGLLGVFIFIWIFGISRGIVNNIYVQISMIMLIGLLAKNAILIVEYAIQRRQQGMSIVEAAVNGAVARLRPILMTSFAFIAGILPLAFSSGAGAVGNQSIGISAIGGMLVGTMIGILVIPSLYIIFQTIQDKFSSSGLINTNDEFIKNKINK